MDIRKTKLMVFNTASQFIKQSMHDIMYGHERLDYIESYTHFSSVFTGSIFSKRGAAVVLLTTMYADLGLNEDVLTDSVPRAMY
mgnify:CR=1 FL=1